MKVLAVHNSYQQPGGEDVVFSAERRLLEEHGHQVVSYERSNHEVEQMSKLQQLKMTTNLVHSSDSKREIEKLLKAEAPDVVHVHNTFMMISPSVFETCHEMNVPVLQTLHNFRLLCPAWSLSREGRVCEECIDHSLWRGVWHGCYRNSHLMTAAVALMLQVHRGRNTWNESVDGFVALSQFARQKFVENGLPAAKMHVKPNFVYQDPGERESAGDYALFVGRLSPEKGVGTLLSAWEKLRTPMPLVIAGEGPERAALEAQATAAHLSNVKFTGRLSAEEVRSSMKRAAFLVMPSVWYEGFPMTIAESFACGTPVICSKLGAMQEIVEHQHTGLHFLPDDAEDLRRQVEYALSRPAEVAAMGKAARQEYEQRYTAQINYATLMNIYEQTIGAHSRN
jgi:glycosyltransferase involved in cell wall biosynthesis